MSTQSTELDGVFAVALRLSPLDKTRLIERLAATLEKEFQPESSAPRRSLYGVLADSGAAPSSEGIDNVRREMWQNFPGEDI